MKKPTKQSMAGLIREHLPTIEQKSSFGWRLSVIHEELLEKGITCNFNTFKNSLHRARKRASTHTEPQPKPIIDEPTRNAGNAGNEPKVTEAYFTRTSLFKQPKEKP